MCLFGTAPNAPKLAGMRMFAVGIICISLIALTGVALAQTATGTINGTITDAKGAAIAGVSVTVHNDETGLDTPEKTNDAGFYIAPLLQPGTYDVTGMQPGFNTVLTKNVRIQVGQTTAIDFQMPVASQQQLVTVTTEAPLIETEKTEQSQNISADLVSNLPTGSRRWEQFVLLTPGVATDGAGGGVSFHGINALYNNNSVDGANNSQAYNGNSRGSSTDGYVYSSDSIREFQVGSNNYSVEVGQAAGGAVNAVTNSGTSQFHGDLFYSGRSGDFNAFDPFAKANAATAPAGTSLATPQQNVHQQHQYGGSAGGPLIKNKLFFFATYDGYRKVLVAPVLTSTPTIGTFCNAGSGLPNVAGFTSNPDGITQATVTADCNAALGYVFSQVLGNYPERLRQDIELVKLDYQLNSSNHLSGVSNIRDWRQPILVTQSGGSTQYEDRFFIGTWNTVIGSNKVNELRYQWGIDKTVATINNTLPGVALGGSGTVSGTSSLFSYGHAGAYYPPGNSETRNQVSDSFSFTHGTHTFKAGVDFNTVYDNVNSSNQLNGAYAYSGVAVPGVCPAATLNQIFCDWILDQFGINTGQLNAGGHYVTGQHYSTFSQFVDQRFSKNAVGTPAGSDQFTDVDYAGYFQDTWKARSNVTLTMGLRYDYQNLPPAPNPNLQIIAGAVIPDILPMFTNNSPHDGGGIQPRLGVAWNLARNTVFRAGMGVFFSKISVSGISSTHRTSGIREQSFTCTPTSATAPCNVANTNGQTGLTFPNVLYSQELQPLPAFTTSVPGATQPLTPAVVGSAVNACVPPSSGCNVRGLDPNTLNPRAYEGEVAIERQMPGQMSLTASYIFTRGVHLPDINDVNLAPTALMKTYDIVDTSGATVQSVTEPLFTSRIVPGTGAILAEQSVINSMYNALVLTLRKPMSHGVEILANYTYSHATDDGEAASTNGGETFLGSPTAPNPYNLKTEQGTSTLDAPNRFTASVVWAPTYGMGLSNRILRGVATGWNLSGTVTATNGTTYSEDISSSSSPCLTTGVKGGSGTNACVGAPGLDGGMTGSVLTTSATPTGSRILWQPRNSFRLPSYSTVDLRLEKAFAIKERYRITIRGEAFNLMNSTIVLAVNQNGYTYAAPGASGCPVAHTNECMIPVAGFATATTTSGTLLGPRQMQAGIRFTF
jgi:hypothetical protein